jgi:hypothetical protein
VPIIPTLGRLRQENLKFKAILGYIKRSCSKTKENKTPLQNYILKRVNFFCLSRHMNSSEKVPQGDFNLLTISSKMKKSALLGVVTHICNPSYLVGEGQKDGSSELTQAKSYQDSISANKPGVMVHAHNGRCEREN